MPLLHTFTCVCVLSVLDCGSAVATETVIGVAGQAVMLPCRSEGAEQRGLEVCWGRGQPSLFTCHNTVIYSAGNTVTYRKSNRFSVSSSSSSSSSSSLSISDLRPSDSGFYHCRVQVPGLFNDETSSVHLIIVHPPPSPPAAEASRVSDKKNERFLNAPQTTTAREQSGRHTPTPDFLLSGRVTEQEDSPVTGDDTTEPMAALVLSSIQKQQIATGLQMFVGNTVRLSFIVFIPALLLTSAYRAWRWSRSGVRPSQPVGGEEGDSPV